MGGMTNPLGPNHPPQLGSGPSEGLHQSGAMQAMQLPVGSMMTNPPTQPLTHHSSQLQGQPHFQQPSSNPRMYQSFADALAESSQPLSGPSMHSMLSHGPSPNLYSQGPAVAGQAFSSQSQVGQGMSLQPHMGQGLSLQPDAGQSSSSQMAIGQGSSLQPGQTDGSLHMHSTGGSLLPNGISLEGSLPEGSAQLTPHMQGGLLPLPLLFSSWNILPSCCSATKGWLSKTYGSCNTASTDCILMIAFAHCTVEGCIQVGSVLY